MAITSPPLELIRAAQADDRRARDRVFSASYDFVSMHARRWVGRCPYVEFEDYLQVGFEGLQVGLEGFDFSRGTQFFTFARDFVSNAMQVLARAESRQKRIYDRSVDHFDIDRSDPLNNIAEASYNRSFRRRVYAALKPFPRHIRKWVVLWLLGTSYVKIGKRFNVCRHQVSAAVKAAMVVFRQRMFPQAYRFKQSPKHSIPLGGVKRRKVVPVVNATPIRTVFQKLRSLASGLYGSVQQSAQKFVQRFTPEGHSEFSGLPGAAEDDSQSSNPAEVTSAPGSGIPPPG